MTRNIVARIALLTAIPVSFLVMGRPVTARQSQRPIFGARVDLVSVDVAVERGGKPVVGLSQEDFEVFDNRVRQKVDRVIRESIPVDVSLVLDVSGSLTGQPLVQLKEAALAFLTALAPGDRAALVTFSQEVAVPQSLTADLSAVRTAVTAMRAAGATALYDATYVAVQLRSPDQTRGVAVVLTDGADNSSWLTADRVVQATEHSDAVVYGIAAHEAVPTAHTPEAMSTPRTLGMARSASAVLDAAPPPPVSGLPQYRFLQRLAATSGGRLFDASFATLHETFAGMLQDIRARYLLTYYPTNPTPGWHALEVKLTRGRANVTARRGTGSKRRLVSAFENPDSENPLDGFGMRMYPRRSSPRVLPSKAVLHV